MRIYKSKTKRGTTPKHMGYTKKAKEVPVKTFNERKSFAK
jgi:hypothetical protein